MVKHRQIFVDGSPVGMVGLDTVFAFLKDQGCRLGDADLGSRLLNHVEQDNYIPYGARDVYAGALTREYAAYLARDEDEGARAAEHRAWRGIPREQVPWYPTVDEDLCDGCGVCLRMCRTGALVAADGGKVKVGEPFACVVGCNACANLCRPGAILFPPRSILEYLQPMGHNSRARAYGGAG